MFDSGFFDAAFFNAAFFDETFFDETCFDAGFFLFTRLGGVGFFLVRRDTAAVRFFAFFATGPSFVLAGVRPSYTSRLTQSAGGTALDLKSTGQLQQHMLWTYYGLRVGLAAIGISLPLLVLFAGGILHHVWFEPSISGYYHTESRLPFLTTRDLFVGGLFAVGACLYLYKGFSNKENIALNMAGVFAVGVAVLPTAAADQASSFHSVLHGTSAVLFFACIAYVSLFRSRDTLPLLPASKRASYARRYFFTGLALIVSPLGAVGLSFLLDPASRFRTMVFWLEALAVWTFAAYWIVKTLEMRETDAERRALDAELERTTQPTPSGRTECVVSAHGR